MFAAGVDGAVFTDAGFITVSSAESVFSHTSKEAIF